MIHGDSDYAMILIICLYLTKVIKTNDLKLNRLQFIIIRSLNNDPDEGDFTKLSFQKKKACNLSREVQVEVRFGDEVAILIILKCEEGQPCWQPCIASQSISNMTYFDVTFINEVVILIILKLTDTAPS